MYLESVIRCSPAFTMSYNFTCAVEFFDFCFKAGLTLLNSGELKLRNSYLSPDAVAPRRPFRPFLEYAFEREEKLDLCAK